MTPTCQRSAHTAELHTRCLQDFAFIKSFFQKCKHFLAVFFFFGFFMLKKAFQPSLNVLKNLIIFDYTFYKP